jgi:hypothetical protein
MTSNNPDHDDVKLFLFLIILAVVAVTITELVLQ